MKSTGPIVQWRRTGFHVSKGGFRPFEAHFKNGFCGTLQRMRGKPPFSTHRFHEVSLRRNHPRTERHRMLGTPAWARLERIKVHDTPSQTGSKSLREPDGRAA
jgi:hypothetical protein